MKLPKRKRSLKAGLPPGSMVYIGKYKSEKLQLRVMNYSEENFTQKTIQKPDEVIPFLQKKDTITWLEVIGINHLEAIEEIGKIFNFHFLVMEDVVNSEQRPKYEDFENYIFFTLKSIELDDPLGGFDYSQISILFGKNFVVTFQENENNLFDVIKKRLVSGVSRARTRKPDFLVYLLLDSIIDSYFDIIEKLAEAIEDTEENMIKDQSGKTISVFQSLRRNLALLLKSMYPLREALSKLEKRDNVFIQTETLLFFRDVYDHTVHLIESIENQRDILAGSMDVYLSSINNQMNAVMKVLTIIATIFIPMSFFASVYGMNFKYFPELNWRYGYLYFWGIILISFISMIFYFKRRKWL